MTIKCHSCAHCGIEPADMNPTCWHPEIKKHFGNEMHITHAVREVCTENYKFFEQHPARESPKINYAQIFKNQWI